MVAARLVLARLASIAFSACSGPEECDPEVLPDPYGCAGFESCDLKRPVCFGNVYACRDGEWQHVGWCDPARHLHIAGPLRLTQMLAAACPGDLTPLPELTLTVSDPSRAVTIEPPATIAATVVEGLSSGKLLGTVTQPWGELDPVVAPMEIELLLGGDGSITGTGRASVETNLGTCDAEVVIAGSHWPTRAWGEPH